MNQDYELSNCTPMNISLMLRRPLAHVSMVEISQQLCYTTDIIIQ